MSGSAQEALSYRLQKERFVSDLTGGSVWEINAVVSVAPAAFFFWAVLHLRLIVYRGPSQIVHPVDLLLNVGAMLAAVTVYADTIGLLLALILLPAIAFCGALVPRVKKKPSGARGARGVKTAPPAVLSPLPEFPLRPYITAYRGGMLVMTAICILAVDFHIFPRRFAKVETYGTSLMDVGVGSFVFSGGMMAARSALKTRMALLDRGAASEKKGKAAVQSRLQHDPQAQKQAGFLTRLASALKTSFPLLLLGLIRLYSVKGLDYAEHVTEYGVHWNFFFTLGFLPIGMAFVEPLLAALPARLPAHLLLGSMISLLHGLALQIDATGLRKWALTAERVDLLSKNREGIVSFAGYLAIFLLGMEAGMFALPREPFAGLGALLSSESHATTRRFKTLRLHAMCSAAYAGVAWLLVNPVMKGTTSLSHPISRRLANPPYVLWIAAFNHFQLFLYLFVEHTQLGRVYDTNDGALERLKSEAASGVVLSSFNAGGLAVFLLSNLGTGLVNITINTLEANSFKAMSILVVYMLACTFAAIGVYWSGFKIKL